MLLVSVHLRQIDFHLRLFQARLGNHLRQKFIHRAADKTDVHRTDVALCEPSGSDGCLLCALQQVLCFDEECSARCGESDATSAAGKQFDTEVMLKQLNLPAQWRLGHVQSLSGAAKVEFGGDGGEAA
ncbi:hypothetical protein D3C87_473640 [compost metagenome]